MAFPSGCSWPISSSSTRCPIAKATPQGQLYFQHHDVPCSVIRAWTVQVNCDYVAAPGVETEKFRIYIDARTSQVVDTDMSFNP